MGKDARQVIDESRSAFTCLFFFFVSIVCLVLVVLCLFEPVTQPDSKAFLSEQLGLGPSASPQRENQACTVLL